MPKNETLDVDALLAMNVRKAAGGICSVGAALGKMDPATRAKIEAAFVDTERFASTGLSAVLRSMGHDVGRSAADRHRRRECKCP